MPILLLYSLHTLVNFAAPSLLFRSAELGAFPSAMSFLFSSSIAQLGLVGLWAVLAPRSWFVRMPITLMAAASLYCVFWGALCLLPQEDEDIGFEGVLSWHAILVLPLALLAVQAPPMLLRAVFGFKAAFHGVTIGLPQESRRFTLAGALAATVIVAAAFALAQLGFALMDMIAEPAPVLPFWLCVSLGLWSTFVLIPTMLAALAVRRAMVGFVALLAYAIVLTVPQAIVAVFGAKDAEFRWVLLTYFMGGAAGTGLALYGSLLGCRVFGYSLTRPGFVAQATTSGRQKCQE